MPQVSISSVLGLQQAHQSPPMLLRIGHGVVATLSASPLDAPALRVQQPAATGRLKLAALKAQMQQEMEEAAAMRIQSCWRGFQVRRRHDRTLRKGLGQRRGRRDRKGPSPGPRAPAAPSRVEPPAPCERPLPPSAAAAASASRRQQPPRPTQRMPPLAHSRRMGVQELLQMDAPRPTLMPQSSVLKQERGGSRDRLPRLAKPESVARQTSHATGSASADKGRASSMPPVAGARPGLGASQPAAARRRSATPRSGCAKNNPYGVQQAAPRKPRR